jgi:hypothetical protein
MAFWMLPLALAGTSAGASALSFRAKSKAAKIRAEMVQMQNARARRDVIRDFRNQRAQALVQGTYQSPLSVSNTMTQGSLSSLGAQTQSALGYIDKQNRLNSSAVDQERKADSLGTFANIAGAAASVTHQFTVAKGGYDKIAEKMGLGR